ncbi:MULTISPECIES: hypothetical protein [Ureibacillus]|uniref:Uncharacterized protein n=1 Tax=Ureibacillus thermosphaericus TaxID=51173 RepID=A0A840PNE2_URETH|nr:hypothetical protein [Ureibacillus thermosphaericus]MBB5148019.1 hypothetical protein [Ureibacillus thermosphaericus]
MRIPGLPKPSAPKRERGLFKAFTEAALKRVKKRGYVRVPPRK